jgi:cystathionine beta-lyase
VKYDFDEIIPRRGTGCVKYDSAARRGRPADVIPLWVADMDFRAPREVVDRLVVAARHGIFGYADCVDDGYYQAVAGWFARYFDFHPEPEWLVTSPGVVFAQSVALSGLTEPGEAVLIQEPVYHPFAKMIRASGRRVIESGLVYGDGGYTIDLDDFERKITQERVRMFILCSPHNPVGRVWTKGELTALGEICLRRDCLVFADEIHCDFTRPGHRHQTFAALSPELAARTVMATAPSKTFNLAGLQGANIFIPDPELRRRYCLAQERTGYGELNNMALAAGRAAYEHGRDWLEQLLAYLEGNLGLLREAAAAWPGISLVEPEGTYLAWLDMRGLGLAPAALDDLITSRARLWLDEGRKFGPSGEGFYRLNLASPRPVLREALGRLDTALKSL